MPHRVRAILEAAGWVYNVVSMALHLIVCCVPIWCTRTVRRTQYEYKYREILGCLHAVSVKREEGSCSGTVGIRAGLGRVQSKFIHHDSGNDRE